ncbi:hypothetical protein [Streptomyces sp. NPDC002994]|uniref:hypothetical protein n=1 Tax=Streptomyces sp. NPDC002994 TaxID=3154441 RepID=UPI0033B9F793
MTTTQRYGDLELSFRTAQGTGGSIGSTHMPFTGYDGHTTPTERLSSGHKVGLIDRDPKGGVLMLKDVSADGSLLRPPVTWERVAQLPLDGQFPYGVWRPIPPEGYVALGDIVFRWDYELEQFPDWLCWTACVKKTHNGRPYVRQGECGTVLYDSGSLRLWSVVNPPYPDGDLDEHLFLPCGNFTAVTSSGTPAPTPTTWVLDLPAVIEKRDGPEIPELTSHARPPATTVITDRTVTVPYFMIDDRGREEDWKLENSPFYKVRRKRHFELILYRDNRNGTVPQEESQMVKTGVSKEEGETFTENTGITVGMSAGVSAGGKPFGIGVEATVTTSVSTTIELGYERRTNITTMREEAKTRGLTIPEHSSACLWMEHHELLPVRANGDTLGSQAALGFTTDYYVTGQYPSAAGASYFEVDGDGRQTTKADRHLPTARPVTV